MKPAQVERQLRALADDLGKPGELGISRDEWLEQSSKVLGEGLWDDLKNKVRIY